MNNKDINIDSINPKKFFDEKQKTDLSPQTQVQTGDILSNVETIINPIETLKHSTHTRAKGLLEWIGNNDVNKNWYIRATKYKRFALVDDGIMFLGDVFDLDDVSLPDSELKEGINNDKGITYFDFDSAQLYAKKCGKNIPKDWTKYIDLLPGNEENKVNFLLKVLGLSFAGSRNWEDISFHNQGKNGIYWSATRSGSNGYALYFYPTGIYPNNTNYQTFGFPIRLIKPGNNN